MSDKEFDDADPIGIEEMKRAPRRVVEMPSRRMFPENGSSYWR